MRVERVGGSHRIVGCSTVDGDFANAYLSHLEVRAFASLTVRSYAFHVLSFLRFCSDRGLSLLSVTAMDVFEHLTDPVEAVENLWKALNPGGFLYARIAAESDEDRPQHIVQDFAPTFERMRALGLVEVWRDEWLWGHQVFQKS